MSTFKLQVHSRDLAIPVIGNMASHTGYDLVEYDNNGNVLSISSVDLIEENGEIRFDIREKRPGKTYIIDGKTQAWPNNIHFDDDPNQAVDQEFAEDNHFYTADIPVADPQAMFDRIVFDAKFRNALADSNVAGGGINYQALGPNCNTWTNYIGTQFIGTNVFNRLPASDGIIYDYTGNNKTFNDCSNANDRENCALLEEYSQRFFNDMSGRDIGDVNVAIGGTAAGGWYCRISDCNIDGTLYTYTYDTAEDCFITLSDKNDKVYAGDGENKVDLEGGNDYYEGGKDVDKVTTRNGRDEIYTYDGDDDVEAIVGAFATDEKHIYLGDGNDKFRGGVGKDYVWSGQGDDNISTGANNDKVYTTDGAETDTNTVDLGAGNDEFYGGAGIDIVETGAGKDTVHTGAGDDKVDTTASDKEDVNKVYLGAGSDEFKGGIGRDIVDGGVSDDGTNDTNEIYLGAGNDEYHGGQGKDIVHGGNGEDYISGGDKADILHGDGGNDIINGGEGNNEIHGGTGNDKIYAGTKNHANDNEINILRKSA